MDIIVTEAGAFYVDGKDFIYSRKNPENPTGFMP